MTWAKKVQRKNWQSLTWSPGVYVLNNQITIKTTKHAKHTKKIKPTFKQKTNKTKQIFAKL
jgi:hypothetical protein